MGSEIWVSKLREPAWAVVARDAMSAILLYCVAMSGCADQSSARNGDEFDRSAGGRGATMDGGGAPIVDGGGAIVDRGAGSIDAGGRGGQSNISQGGTHTTGGRNGGTGGASVDDDAAADSGSDEPRCGDGALAEDEACDDGNVADDDGCTAACRIQQGWRCTDAEPSVCRGLLVRTLYDSTDLSDRFLETASLVLDGQGNVHVVFSDWDRYVDQDAGDSGIFQRFYYATNDPDDTRGQESWLVEEISELHAAHLEEIGGRGNSIPQDRNSLKIFVDEGGTVRVVVDSSTFGGTHFVATRSAGQWSIESFYSYLVDAHHDGSQWHFIDGAYYEWGQLGSLTGQEYLQEYRLVVDLGGVVWNYPSYERYPSMVDTTYTVHRRRGPDDWEAIYTYANGADGFQAWTAWRPILHRDGSTAFVHTVAPTVDGFAPDMVLVEPDGDAWKTSSLAEVQFVNDEREAADPPEYTSYLEAAAAPDGTIHIFYFANSEPAMFHLIRRRGTWERLAWPQNLVESVAVDADGVVHLLRIHKVSDQGAERLDYHRIYVP